MQFDGNTVEHFFNIDVIFGTSLIEVSFDTAGQGLSLCLGDSPLILKVALEGGNGDGDILFGKVADILQPVCDMLKR